MADSGAALISQMSQHPLLLGGFTFEYSDEPWKGQWGSPCCCGALPARGGGGVFFLPASPNYTVTDCSDPRADPLIAAVVQFQSTATSSVDAWGSGRDYLNVWDACNGRCIRKIVVA